MRMRGSMGGPNRMGPYDRERGFGRGRGGGGGGGGGGGIPRLMDFGRCYYWTVVLIEISLQPFRVFVPVCIVGQCV